MGYTSNPGMLANLLLKSSAASLHALRVDETADGKSVGYLRHVHCLQVPFSRRPELSVGKVGVTHGLASANKDSGTIGPGTTGGWPPGAEMPPLLPLTS